MYLRVLQSYVLVAVTGIMIVLNPIATTNTLYVNNSIEYHEEELLQIDSSLSNESTHTTYEEVLKDSADQINEEVRLGEMEILALLVHAEAGNQDLNGKRLVADVVLNRVDDGWADSTVESVVFQFLGKVPQFSTITDGAYDRAGYEVTEDDYKAVEIEYNAEERLDGNIFYFRSGCYSDYGTPAYKYGDHYFSYK